MSKMNNTQIVEQIVSTCRVVPMMDRAAVVDALRREGAVLVDGGPDYEVLLTSATRWVFETDSESPWGLVPAWGAGTRGYADAIFAVLDGKDTLAAQDARHAAQVEATAAQDARIAAAERAALGEQARADAYLCCGCEEAGEILPGHFACSFTP